MEKKKKLDDWTLIQTGLPSRVSVYINKVISFACPSSGAGSLRGAFWLLYLDALTKSLVLELPPPYDFGVPIFCLLNNIWNVFHLHHKNISWPSGVIGIVAPPTPQSKIWGWVDPCSSNQCGYVGRAAPLGRSNGPQSLFLSYLVLAGQQTRWGPPSVCVSRAAPARAHGPMTQ